jgi:anti-sigma28 factor (negative regulator of flagellin synthesis)
VTISDEARDKNRESEIRGEDRVEAARKTDDSIREDRVEAARRADDSGGKDLDSKKVAKKVLDEM